jgi:hypothetical protein
VWSATKATTAVTAFVGRPLEAPVRLCDLLHAGLKANRDGLALISVDTRWTWGQLDELSDRLPCVCSDWGYSRVIVSLH